MMKQTMLNAIMMVETVVDPVSIMSNALTANVLEEEVLPFPMHWLEMDNAMTTPTL